MLRFWPIKKRLKKYLRCHAESATMRRMRNPDSQCITVTLPKALVQSLRRRADEKFSTVSATIREYLIPIMADRDPQFQRIWQKRSRDW
jgi:hypothetical protein